ncbi:twin-arginine translocase subunit TatC [Thiocapsa roseopersicina]|uniref:Sec-independent protein translocase protein TatC n=1 Tax=Thiocapsa roseopersicina TaxID=1058 RepID=A0A1H2V6E4_THIRO|nr:twin-arginine translocase subunit TatC [Thiocapsa roseopersicina]SDW63906.1 sec-independent protein translocase protein TatC [Thiocapsa roseopersicina]
MSPAMQPDDPGAEQPFVSHLIELRDRLIRMSIAIFVVFLALFPFANEIYTFVAAPLMAQLPEGNTMIATQVAAPFLTPFKLALIAAVFLSMPFLLYQFWGFVAPGLYKHEKRLATPLLISSIFLFYIGVAFAYFLVFPLIFAFLSASTPDGVAMMTDISAYLDFVLALFFAFGIAFEIPIATILLVAVGITTPADLVRMRPYVIVGAFVVGMLLTPPDVISQTLLAVPMWLLFELGIVFSKVLVRKRANDTDEDPDPDASDSASSRAPSTPDGPIGGSTMGRVTPRPQTREIGRDLDPHFDDPDRWQPLSESEMEAELDLIEADEILDAPRHFGPDATQTTQTAIPAGAPAINSVEEKIRRANRLRELGSTFAARTVLYEVLEEGDADQRRVARNILNQLDEA